MRTIPILALAIFLTGCGTTAVGSSQAAAPLTHSWSHPPPMTINPAHSYFATLTTSDGVIRVQLLPKIAPLTVNNFVFLARHHFYDELIFHRIVKGFVVQTGDPTGTGLGGPGYHFRNEKVTLKYTPGTLAMANSGTNTNGSQFFIVTGPAAQKVLRAQYTIFGHVIAGMNIVQKLNNTPVQPNVATGELSTPTHDVYLKSVTIQESR